MTAMLEAATNKLLHAPTTKLRALASDPRAHDYVEALVDLFELPSEPEKGGEDHQAEQSDVRH